MRATMDLIAAYKYDNTILDLLVLPEALDRATLIDNLLMETAEREIIYSNLGFLKQAIGSWSHKNLSVWEELYKTQHYEYNPIWNKDGSIIELETRDLKGTNYHTDNTDRVDNLTDKNIRDYQEKETRNLTDKETRNLTDTETKDLNDLTQESVYGFNSSTDAPASKTESDHTGTNTTNYTGTDTTDHTGTDTINHTGTDTMDHTGRQDIDRVYDEKTSDSGTIKHERTEQGNIGLTSTQDLIKQQQELVKFNLMDYIIEDFSKKFCLGVY